MPESRQSKAVIAVADDDLSVREGLESLIRSAGRRGETFASSQDSSPVRAPSRQAVWCWTCNCRG
jgi:FixJ family two-component response regulator